ncbi:MAG: shikimate dehydrogenase [Sulfolobales archaeon]|nr:shikimate dehydrogenase [Sulfolobales archaeon]
MKHPRLICLIGDPVEHSISPVIHNEAFRRLGLNYIYLTFRVRSDDLEHAVKGLKALGAVGFNVTLPHKVSIIKYLDEVTPEAMSIGSVNTVVNDGGKLIGYNTDVVGVVNTFKSLGVNVLNVNAAVLGAGGASRAVINALIKCGVGKVLLINRTLEKAVEVARDCRSASPNTEVIPMELNSRNLQLALSQSEILINTTSVGMYPNVDDSLVPKNLIRDDLIVMDIVYNPVETKLLRDAKERGAKTINGVYMLVHQAAAAFKLWTGVDPPLELMFTAAYSALR